jgi:hypothetical protein
VVKKRMEEHTAMKGLFKALDRWACRLALASGIWFAAAGLAWPLECLSPGPGGEAAPRDLVDRERRDLRTLFDTLDGEWNGGGEGFFCREGGGADREDVRYVVEAEGEVDSSGDLTIGADLYPEDRSVRQTETLRLYLREGRLRAGDLSGAGDVEPVEATYRRLVYRQTYRQQAATGGGLVKDVHTVIEATYHGFRFERRIYTQGRLTAGLTWSLTRR